MRRYALTLGVALALGIGGCSGKGVDLAALVTPRVIDRPAPDSPTAALRLFEWSYNNRDTVGCRELFTEDYHFLFSPLDSAGASYRTVPWSRTDELIYTLHLFHTGSKDAAPAASISFALDKTFYVQPDPNYAVSDPGGRWHTRIRTQVVLDVRTADGSGVNIVGGADFYLVRSDSADVPSDFASHVSPRDTTRWWVRRWIDETAGPPGGPVTEPVRGMGDRKAAPLAIQPSSKITWGWVKVVYR